MSHPPLWLRFLLAWVIQQALGACGYIGYDARETDEAGGAGDGGLDAALEPPPDADEPVPLDAAQDAELVPDASELDAGPELDAAQDADLLDAMVSDAGTDAATLDSGADASDAAEDARQATQVSDYCMQLPALPDEPVIDGLVDGALALSTLVPQDWSNTSVPLPTHTTAAYAFAFRPNGLYAFVRVRDPSRLPSPLTDAVWRGDSVELYADQDGVTATQDLYDNPGTVQLVVGAPDNDVTALSRGTRYREAAEVGAWTSSRFAAYPTADGYVVEAFLEASALDLASWALATGGRVGIDVGINVSPFGEADAGADAGVTVEGQRLGQYFLRVGTGDSCNGRPFCTPAAFCTPLLVD